MRIKSGLVAAVVLCVGTLMQRLPGVEVEPVIVLPPFIVSDTKVPWRHVSGPRFEVLSRCSDRITRDVFDRHERLLDLLGLVLPPELQVVMDVPDTIILEKLQAAPALSREMLAQFGAANASGAERREGTADRRRIEFFDNMALDDIDARAVFSAVDERRFRAEGLTFSPERIKFALDRRVPALPPWFVEGFMALQPAIHFRFNSVEVERFLWLDEKQTTALQKNPSRPVTFMMTAELFEDPPPEDIPGNAELVQLWRTQAALIIRWALDPKQAKLRQSFWRLVQRTSTEPMTSELLREHIGLDYADLQDALSKYLPRAVREGFVLRPESGMRAPGPEIRDATPAEVVRIKGDWERLVLRYVRSNHPEFASRYEQQARKTLQQAYADNVRDLPVLAVYGLLETDEGHSVEAQRLLAAAVEGGVRRPRAYLELARLRYADALAHPAGVGGRLSESQINQIFAPLIAGRSQNPVFASSYLLAAEIWTRNGLALTASDFAMLDEGTRLFPRNAALVGYVAVLRTAQGLDKESLDLIDRTLALGVIGPADARLRQLRDVITAARAKQKPEAP